MFSYLTCAVKPSGRLFSTSATLVSRSRVCARFAQNAPALAIAHRVPRRSFQRSATNEEPAMIENNATNPIPILPSAPATSSSTVSPDLVDPLVKVPKPPRTVADTANSKIQSISPLAPIGVHAALLHAAAPSNEPSLAARPKIFEEFSLAGRVGVVTGANRGSVGANFTLLTYANT